MLSFGCFVNKNCHKKTIPYLVKHMPAEDYRVNNRCCL